MKNTINKNELFYSQYHIAIENNRTKNYFTEKLVDCFQTKTIPIYFGCTNIGDYFDTRGIFQVDSIEEIIHVCNSLRENTYDKMLEFVETNYRLSMDYVDIISKIKNNINKKIKNMQTLEEIYEKNASTPSDINEHLPTLKKYAQECETIVEMGVRTIVSTWAFLSGNPKKLISVDYKYPIDYNSNDLPIVENIAKEKNIDFSFVLGDTRNLTIPECDLLFIDTLHTYSQIKIELNLHSPKVKKYIIFHDTVSFRHIGENNLDKGIWPAIEEFLSQNPEWKIHEVYENNNGLTVIKRN
jgi:hypothetical protein